jgi:CBS domain-containing protein
MREMLRQVLDAQVDRLVVLDELDRPIGIIAATDILGAVARAASIDPCMIEAFAAELTAAVYLIALRHGLGKAWLELELGLWKVVGETVNKWQPSFFAP